MRDTIVRQQLASYDDSLKARLAVQQSEVDQARAILRLKARQRDEEMKKLQRDLRKAVTEEKYEIAAGLRDRIQQLETGTGGAI